MTLFGTGYGIGLEVGHRALRAVCLRRKGGSLALDASASADLPDGALLDSFTEPNVADMPAFVTALKGLLGRLGRKWKRVSVALPDYVTRVSILDFDSAQSKDDETERMIRWRLKKQTPFDVDQAALRWQYLGRFGTKEKDTHRYLASIIKADILAQYDLAFKEAGLGPHSVGISSFAVWNLFQDLVLKEAAGNTGFALMNIFGRKMTVMVFEQGTPHFLRLKDLGKLDLAENTEGSMSVTRVLRELSASLTFYKENYAAAPVGKVFMAGDFAGLAGIAEEAGKASGMEVGLLNIEKVVQTGGAVGGEVGLLAYAAACGAALER